MQSCRLSASMTYTVSPMHTLPSVTTRGERRGRTRALCPHRHLPQRLLSPQRYSQAAILACSTVLAPADLRSLRDSRTYGIVRTLADLAFSRGSSLLSNLLVYLVVWWVKIYTLQKHLGYFNDIFGCLSCISVTNKIINVDVTVLQHLHIVQVPRP